MVSVEFRDSGLSRVETLLGGSGELEGQAFFSQYVETNILSPMILG